MLKIECSEGVKAALSFVEPFIYPEESESKPFYSLCWREIALICSENGLIQQASAVAKYDVNIQ